MATQPDENKPTIVLVHGAWADATGFDAEIRALQREGFRAIGARVGAVGLDDFHNSRAAAPTTVARLVEIVQRHNTHAGDLRASNPWQSSHVS